jgi:hypothetical protein
MISYLQTLGAPAMAAIALALITSRREVAVSIPNALPKFHRSGYKDRSVEMLRSFHSLSAAEICIACFSADW